MRAAAIEALGQLDDPRALPTLQTLLTDQKQSARLNVAVLRALVRLDRQNPFPYLLIVVQAPNLLVRKEAVSELIRSYQNDTCALPPLLAALSNPKDQVHPRVTRVLKSRNDVRDRASARGPQRWGLAGPRAGGRRAGEAERCASSGTADRAAGRRGVWGPYRGDQRTGGPGETRALRPLCALRADSNHEVVWQARKALAQVQRRQEEGSAQES